MSRRCEYRLHRMPKRISVRQFQTTGNQRHCRHRHQPRRPTRPPRPTLLGHQSLPQPFLQTLAESRRHLQHPLVPIQLNHIPRPRQQRRAALASSKMFVHRRAQSRIHFSIDVIRNLAPHLFAIQHFLIHYHGLFPFSNGSRLNQPCSHPAASRSRSISRARNSRVFTEATVIPSASAVS